MENKAFDYIVIGGGSAGCVLAGRLSKIQIFQCGTLKAGSHGNSWTVNTPAAAVISIPAKSITGPFEAVPQKGLNGRKGYQPRGKCLGGSSAINAMIYVRGHQKDYDQWAELGNHGWSYQEVLPILFAQKKQSRY